MVLTVTELLNSQSILKEANQLEAQIDEHLQTYFSEEFDEIPLLIVDKQREIVKEKIIKMYENAGWNINFIQTEDPSQVGISIKQQYNTF